MEEHVAAQAYYSPMKDMQGSLRMVSIREELTRNITEFERMLENKRAMLKLLDENPVIEKFINLQRGY
jgi:hypothetical protein